MAYMHRVGFKRSYLRGSFWRGNAAILSMVGITALLIGLAVVALLTD